MKVRLLHTEGDGTFKETEWDKPDPTFVELEVKAVMTGVCRSDVAMMNGNFGPLPLNMQGHEGLGQVTKVGHSLKDLVNIGDFVATRGEPAYADYYNVRHGEFVKVPEAHPRYILEPVACGVNIITQEIYMLKRRIQRGKPSRVLIMGSGFLAYVAYQTLKNKILYDIPMSVDVVGSSNKELWELLDVELKSRPEGLYDLLIDLSSSNVIINGKHCATNSMILMCTEKTAPNDITFENLLWKACLMIFPSPRSLTFGHSMVQAAQLVQQKEIIVDKFWTKGYDRDTEWQNAFLDSKNRTLNYGRAYIKWN
jgi:Alcohol dehydrogenase GroES-like domain